MDARRKKDRFRQGSTHRAPWYAGEVLRLLASLAIILTVALCSRLLPTLAASWKAVCGTLVLSQTDFEQAFSDLGRMIADGDLSGAVEDWCAAVFAPQEDGAAAAASSNADEESETEPEAATPEAGSADNAQRSEA